jgi:hypothetical protein
MRSCRQTLTGLDTAFPPWQAYYRQILAAEPGHVQAVTQQLAWLGKVGSETSSMKAPSGVPAIIYRPWIAHRRYHRQGGSSWGESGLQLTSEGAAEMLG